jgi:glycosyltransferase involved in cell wall biosynthesis
MAAPSPWRRIAPAALRRAGGRWLSSLERLPAVLRGAVSILLGAPVRGRLLVSYGHLHIPTPAEPSHGGMVKLQRLHASFPNSPRRFNVLYLVSSCLPEGATTLVRLSRFRGGRLVLNQNGVAYPGWSSDWRRMNAPLARVLRAADHVFYQSEFCKRAADEFLGPAPRGWEILYNCVDTDAFTPARQDPDPGRLTLLLGGTQDQEYRFSSAVRTLAAVVARGVDARLLVAGRLRWAPDAQARAAALSLVEELGLERRVELTGPYAQKDAPALLRRAHLLLHTKYNDPSPGLVIEAMACGLPVVYSASGGVPELVGGEAGRGVPAELRWDSEVPPDPEALAEAVLEVARDRPALAAAARRRCVERFGLLPWLRRHRDVFERLQA